MTISSPSIVKMI